MDWKELGRKIARYAPELGAVFGGPGGAAIGTLASMVASAFGLEPEAEPEEIAAVIERDPQAAIKLKEIETNAIVEIRRLNVQLAIQQSQEEVAKMQAINTTMQVESKSEHWPQWAWRPFWGFTSGTAFLSVCVFICYLSYKAVIMKDASAIGSIPLIIGAFTSLFSIAGAVLGITAWGRNKLKVKQMEKSFNLLSVENSD